MIPTRVTYTGKSKSYRVGKFRIQRGEEATVNDPELLNYLLTVKGFRVVERKPAPAPTVSPAPAPAVQATAQAELPPATPPAAPAPKGDKAGKKPRRVRRILGGGKK